MRLRRAIEILSEMEMLYRLPRKVFYIRYSRETSDKNNDKSYILAMTGQVIEM